MNVGPPPGLEPGDHSAPVKLADSTWSNEQTFFLGPETLTNKLELAGIQDGVSWSPGETSWDTGGWISAWIGGLSPEAELGNVRVEISGVPHRPESVHPKTGQLNLSLRPVIIEGSHSVTVEHRGGRKPPLTLQATGVAHAVKGLESLWK